MGIILVNIFIPELLTGLLAAHLLEEGPDISHYTLKMLPKSDILMSPSLFTPEFL